MDADAGSAKPDQDVRRAAALLKMQQSMQTQGDTDSYKVVALNRQLKSVPADALAQARSQTAPVAPVAPASTASSASVAAAPARAAVGPPGLPPSTDRIQLPMNNGRITLNPSAVLLYGAHEERLEFSSAGALSFQDLRMSADEQGQVVLYVPVTWAFPPMGNRPAEAALTGHGLAHVVVPFTVGPDKDKPDQLAITWQNPRTLGMSSDGGGATLTGAPVTTDVTGDGGAATITPTVQFQEQLSHAVTKAGDTLSVGGGVSVAVVSESATVTTDIGDGSTQGHQEQSQVNETDSFSESFTVTLALPKAEPLPATPELEVLFAVNSDATATNGDEEKVTRWYESLDKKVRDSVEAGKTRIGILGKASATGSFDYNRKLAHRRVERVKDILSDLAGSDAKIHTQAVGRAQPQYTGEDPEERVVWVWLGEERPARAN